MPSNSLKILFNGYQMNLFTSTFKITVKFQFHFCISKCNRNTRGTYRLNAIIPSQNAVQVNRSFTENVKLPGSTVNVDPIAV